jgi:hypothetical protein
MPRAIEAYRLIQLRIALPGTAPLTRALVLQIRVLLLSSNLGRERFGLADAMTPWLTLVRATTWRCGGEPRRGAVVASGRAITLTRYGLGAEARSRG